MNDINKAIFAGRLGADSRTTPNGDVFFDVASSIYVKKSEEEMAADSNGHTHKSIPSYLTCKMGARLAKVFPVDRLVKGTKVYIEARQTSYLDKKNSLFRKDSKTGEMIAVNPKITVNNIDSIDLID